MKLPASMHVFERGWLSSNNILFTGRNHSALIDSGYASHADQTLALVGLGLGARPLDLLVNTHLHSDHCGGNHALQERWSPRTLIPVAEADSIANWRSTELNAVQTGQTLERFAFDGTIAAGDEIELGDLLWQVLASPGHDPHSMVLYCPAEAILISADAFWENGFGVIFPELVGESGFAQARATLEMIAGLEVRLVIPGHGSPFETIDESLARAFSRIDRMSSDPVSHARYALKVFLKFLLLDHQAIRLDELPGRLAGIPYVAATNTRYLHLEPAELVDWLVRDLVRSNAARVDSDVLVNAG